MTSFPLSIRGTSSALLLVFTAISLLPGCDRSDKQNQEAVAAPAAPSPTPLESDREAEVPPPLLDLPIHWLSMMEITMASDSPVTILLTLPLDHERADLFVQNSGFAFPPGAPWVHGSTSGEILSFQKHASDRGYITTLSQGACEADASITLRSSGGSGCEIPLTLPTHGIIPIKKEFHITNDRELLLKGFGSCFLLEVLNPTPDRLRHFAGEEFSQRFEFCQGLKVESFCGSVDQGIGALSYAGSKAPLYDLRRGRIELITVPRMESILLDTRFYLQDIYDATAAIEDQRVWVRTGSPSEQALISRTASLPFSTALSPHPTMRWLSEDHTFSCEIPIPDPSPGRCSTGDHIRFESLPAGAEIPAQEPRTTSPSCRLSWDCVAQENCTVGLFEGACVEYQYCSAMERECLPQALDGPITDECAALFACHASPGCRALLIDDECRMTDRETFAEMLDSGSLRLADHQPIRD